MTLDSLGTLSTADESKRFPKGIHVIGADGRPSDPKVEEVPKRQQIIGGVKMEIQPIMMEIYPIIMVIQPMIMAILLMNPLKTPLLGVISRFSIRQPRYCSGGWRSTMPGATSPVSNPFSSTRPIVTNIRTRKRSKA